MGKNTTSRIAFSVVIAAGVELASGQTALDDTQSRITLNQALSNLRITDALNPSAFSFQLRMDTTEVLGTRTTYYTSQLRVYREELPTSSLLKAELWNLRGAQTLHRIVADGTRTWSLFAPENEYSVSQYDTDNANQSTDYFVDFSRQFKSTVKGSAASLIQIGDQAGLTRDNQPRIADWIGGVPFVGLETGGTRVIWQETVDSLRYAKFTCFAGPSGWALDNVEIFRKDRVGSLDRTTTSVVTVDRDPMGNPYAPSRNSSDFVFTKPLGSKILASPKAIRF
jgi:hypothetical protein